jgi:hypothetical protein
MTFSIGAYLDEALGTDPAARKLLLDTSEGRRAVTQADPLLFALVYLRHHLASDATAGAVSFGDMHLEWYRRARGLMHRQRKSRSVEVAPREAGKSTVWFLVVPLWAAAHGHSRFAAAFAASATQAEGHLASFKRELETNDLLRADYPDLCAPRVRARGIIAADRVTLYESASGFVFSANGVDSSVLGKKVGNLRPDLLILDDIEPDEAKYSGELKVKRLGTLLDAILPLNNNARVVLVGTVTMPDSIVHDAVKVAAGEIGTERGSAAEWLAEDWEVHHYLPTAVDPVTGEERPTWPERWSMEWIKANRHTRSYAKNYLNDPIGSDGAYWKAEHFVREQLQPVHVLLSIDPAVSSKGTSDYTGVSCLEYEPPSAAFPAGRVRVAWAKRLRVTGDELRAFVLTTLAADQRIGLVYVETNQGGDLWKTVLHGLPVKVKTKHQTEAKPLRAARVLNLYERRLVLHADGLLDLEREMVAFPKAPHDDLVDSVGTGVLYFIGAEKKPGGRSRTRSRVVTPA